MPTYGTYYSHLQSILQDTILSDKTVTSRNSEKALRIDAMWDNEAGVWSASSKDIQGLAIEAETREALIDRLKTIIPELLELNHAGSGRVPNIDVVVGEQQHFRLAS